MRKATISGLMVLAVGAMMLLKPAEANAQLFASFTKLSKPERKWVIFHPIAAFRTRKLPKIALEEALSRKNDAELDDDIDGGMLDAFKHTLWMALTAQKIGKDKALSLGDAHEETARLTFKADPKRKNVMQDSIASRMDVLNNNVGASIGDSHSEASYKEIVDMVRNAVIDGKCWKVKKDDKKNYISSDGKIIAIHDYDGKWAIPKVLVPSCKID